MTPDGTGPGEQSVPGSKPLGWDEVRERIAPRRAELTFQASALGLWLFSSAMTAACALGTLIFLAPREGPIPARSFWLVGLAAVPFAWIFKTAMAALARASTMRILILPEAILVTNPRRDPLVRQGAKMFSTASAFVEVVSRKYRDPTDPNEFRQERDVFLVQVGADGASVEIRPRLAEDRRNAEALAERLRFLIAAVQSPDVPYRAPSVPE